MFTKKRNLSVLIILLLFLTTISFGLGRTYKYVGVTIGKIKLHKTYDYGKYCNAYCKIVVRSLKKYSRWRGKETYLGEGQTPARSVPQPRTRTPSPTFYNKIDIVPRLPHTVVVYITMIDKDIGRDRVIGKFRVVPTSSNTVTNYSAGGVTAKIRLYFHNWK